MDNLNHPKTPYILADKTILTERVSSYLTIGDVFFPVKANRHEGLLRHLHACGCGFNVNCMAYVETLGAICTPEELASRVLFDNCMSAPSVYQQAYERGVRLFTVDNRETLDFLLALQDRTVKLFVKLALDEIIDGHQKNGTTCHEELVACIPAEQYAGLSFYLPHTCFELNRFRRVLGEIASRTAYIPCLNLGGALDGILEDPAYRAELGALRHKCGGFIVEPGRNLLNPACKMVSTVTNIVRKNNKKWVALDASVYSGLLDLYIENKRYEMFDPVSSEKEPCMVVGHTSDSCDCFGEYLLSAELKVGNKVYIGACGAYTYGMNVQYSGAEDTALYLV